MMAKKLPLRMCTGCGEMKVKKDMIRVLKTPEGDITIDATGKKNGRGAYICNSLACLQKAVKSRGLERSLRTEIPPELMESLTKEMVLLESDRKEGV